MKLLVAAAVLTVASYSVSLEDLEFHTWKLRFGKRRLQTDFQVLPEGADLPVTHVNNQNMRQCFPAKPSVQLAEEFWRVRTSGRLVSLSEHQLLDCSSAYGNKDSCGGWVDNFFRYIKDNVDTDS
ncbi:procathepsin L-like [Scomber scombrus]|uniref:procathepsin L-like n=1 Tax=Scomber scombrus TaxID=13677 RepID=UPI002DDAE31F|nr:procathepsin L-like [Scomber scombrus]